MINWEQDFLLSNSINHSYDYRPNWTPLGPLTTINYTGMMRTLSNHKHYMHSVQSTLKSGWW